MRGDLTKWCQELQTGVYVGNVNAKIRELLWQRINDNIGRGEATLVYSTNNELGYTFRTTRKDKEIIDADGIPIMKTLFRAPTIKHHGFSNAYRYHQAKKRTIVRPTSKNFVALDLETTGLKPNKDQIISIGAIKVNGNKRSDFYKLIKLESGHTVPADIAEVTKLDDHLLNRCGIDLKDAIVDLQHFVDSMPIVGYNLLFDQRFLQVAIIKHKLIQFNNRMIDLLPYVKKVDPFCDNYHLSTILNKYDIKNDSPHNARSDANATMLLTEKLIENKGLRI